MANDRKRNDLLKRYEKLLKDAHRLSTSNRKASDQAYAEAQAILLEIDKMDK